MATINALFLDSHAALVSRVVAWFRRYREAGISCLASLVNIPYGGPMGA